MRRLGLIGMAGAAIAVAWAPAAHAGNVEVTGPVGTACEDVSGPCTEVVSPWIQNRALGSASWPVACPSDFPYNWAENAGISNDAVGFDAQSRWLSSPDTAISGNFAGRVSNGSVAPGTANLYVINWDARRRFSWRYSIGCGQRAFGRGVSRPGSLSRPPLVRVARLQARGVQVVRHSCPAGRSLVQARQGVGFFTRRPPARAAHSLHVTRTDRTMIYTVTTYGVPARTSLASLIDCA